LDRRTDRSDGSGRASPAVVTSRSADDDLIGDDQDTRSSDVIAPPRQSASTPTAAKSASARTAPADDAPSDGTAGGGVSVNGAPAGGNGIGETRDASANGAQDASANGSPPVATPKDTARASAVDATLAESVPALPADSIGSSRSTRPKGPDPDRETPDSQASEPSPFDDSPAFSFEPSARTGPAAWTATDPAESATKPSDDDASSSAPSGPGSSGPGSSDTVPSGHLSSSAPTVSAEPPALSPAAFAWEMPDPPPNSRSSPARAFLRSGSTVKDPPAPKPASSANPGQTAAGMATAGIATAGVATADKTAAGEGPVTVQSAPRKAQSKRSKRSARQAHLTIARVEPWSVMKFSFVVSLVAFVILFVAVSVLYATLSGLGVFDSLQHLVKSLTSSQDSAGVNAKVWFTASKVLGYTALLGSLNIVLITAMCTIGSVVYNLTSRLVGGVEVTLRETD
jgi:Transmembrane domain of unknown function (DUF3566)